MQHKHPRPDFIIGGAPRSGTTFLCHALDSHPEVYMAKPFIPEPKVFMGPRRTNAEYLERYAALFAEAPSGAVLGEKTSYYLESEDACHRIHETTPDAKIIFIVREPVARAYSNYLWSTLNGLETLPFDQAIAMQGKRPDPLPPEKSYAKPFDYLTRGDYARFARKYFDVLGRENVRFFLYEHLRTGPEQLLMDIQNFIGVEPLPISRLYSGVVNSAADVGPPIDPIVERELRNQMREPVQEFARITNLDLSAWGYAT
jgi:hypothetical protein